MNLEKDEFGLLMWASILRVISGKCKRAKSRGKYTKKMQKLPKRSRIKNQEIKSQTE